jgi:hypothetical protein
MFTKIRKHKSKLISKVVDVIYYGGCQLKRKTYQIHMNEGLSKDF